MVMQSMVERYGSDPQATDICRALRLPGFMHRKGTPHPVILCERTGHRYTRQQILEAFLPERSLNAFASGAVELPAPPIVPEWEPGRCYDARDWHVERIVDALRCIPADDRHDWLTVGMALHYGSNGSAEGFDLWDQWSQTTMAGNYKQADQERAWRGFSPDRADPVTLATLFALAREYGWAGLPTALASIVVPEFRFDVDRTPNSFVMATIQSIRHESKALVTHRRQNNGPAWNKL